MTRADHILKSQYIPLKDFKCQGSALSHMESIRSRRRLKCQRIIFGGGGGMSPCLMASGLSTGASEVKSGINILIGDKSCCKSVAAPS